jgi:hypothetical protein
MVRITAAALGLAVGVSVLGYHGPASAAHILLRASGPDDTASVIDPVPPEPAISVIDEPLILFGDLRRELGSTFVHRFNFGVDLPADFAEAPGGVSAVANYLEIISDGTLIPTAGFERFEGVLTGPNLPAGGLVLDAHGDVPGQQHLTIGFAAIDTGGATPYQLTITGDLLDVATVAAGNYSGNISVVPLPGAIVLFLTALGGLAIFRFRRRSGDTAAA